MLGNISSHLWFCMCSLKTFLVFERREKRYLRPFLRLFSRLPSISLCLSLLISPAVTIGDLSSLWALTSPQLSLHSPFPMQISRSCQSFYRDFKTLVPLTLMGCPFLPPGWHMSAVASSFLLIVDRGIPLFKRSIAYAQGARSPQR